MNRLDKESKAYTVLTLTKFPTTEVDKIKKEQGLAKSFDKVQELNKRLSEAKKEYDELRRSE